MTWETTFLLIDSAIGWTNRASGYGGRRQPRESYRRQAPLRQ